jgi:hypothetical protein
MFDKSTQTELEDLWKKLNPYPEGSYNWYGWSLEVDCNVPLADTVIAIP